MGVSVIRKKSRTALGKSNLPGVDYTLNPYTGCMHGCVYCYARLYCPQEVRERWGAVVIVKENIAEILAKEIRKKRKGRVMVSTITDAYQPVERNERLMRKVLEMLLNSGFKVSIQTKSDLVLRDLDLLTQSKLADVGFTITTLDEKLAKEIEPNATPPQRRVRALERLSSEGVKTWIFLGPIIPELDESEIKEIIEIARFTSSMLYYDIYRVRSFMKTGIEGILAEKARKMNWKTITTKIREICHRRGVKVASAFWY